MSSAVRVSDLVKIYENREKSGDFADWVSKMELVAKLQKVKDLCSFLPLFLGGGAFAVYKQLSEEVRGDYDRLKGNLTAAFSIGSLDAYNELMSRRLRPGEGVDELVSDLKRLIGLTGCTEMPVSLLKCAFMVALPAGTRSQLQASTRLEQLSMDELLQRARSLSPQVGLSPPPPLEIDLLTAAGYSGPRGSVTMRCFLCGIPGHQCQRL